VSLLPSTSTCAVMLVTPSLVLRISWLVSEYRGFVCRYSVSIAPHMTSGAISVPESSVMCWIVRENSICKRRGSSKPCSVFIT